MVTRIPQPQFVGPAPSEVAIQNADLGQKIAQMYQSAFQDTVKNHLLQKQTEIEQQKAQAQADYNKEQTAYRLSAEQQAKNLAISKEFESEMSKVDPSEQWEVLYKNKPLSIQYFTGIAGGDKELGEKLYQSALQTAVNIGSGKSFLATGGFGWNPQAAAAPQGAPVTGSPTPVVPPGAPMPPRPAMIQNANPTVSPTAQNAAPYGAAAPSKIPPATGATPAVGVSPQAQTATTTQGNQSLVDSLHIKTNNPRSALGSAVIQKFEQGAFAATDTVSPKEQAAAKSVLAPTLKVLESSGIVQDLEKEGVTAQMLQGKVDQLNDAIAKDPQFGEYLRATAGLSPQDTKDFLAYKKSDDALDAASQKLDLQREGLELKKGDLALNAAKIEGSLQIGWERARTSGRNAETAAFQAANAAMTAYSQHWSAELEKYTTANKDNPRAMKLDAIDRYMDSLFSDENKNSALGQEALWTSYLVSRATGQPQDVVLTQLEGSNGFLFGWGSQPPVNYSKTGVPGVTTPGPAGQGATPATPAAKATPSTTPAQGVTQYTPNQLKRMAQGQAPGPAN